MPKYLVTQGDDFVVERQDRTYKGAKSVLFTISGDTGVITAANMTLSGDVTLDDLVSTTLNVGSGKLRANTTGIGVYGKTPIAQQVSGADVTNSVTAGGTNGTIANFTDLSTYANDSDAIRNDIYQLARGLKLVNDALRAYGFLT